MIKRISKEELMQLRKKHGLIGLSISLELIKEIVEKNGGELKEISNNKFKIICLKDGYTWETSWNVIHSGHWCPACAKERSNLKRIQENKKTEEKVVKFIKNKGGKLECNWFYTNNSEKIKIECSKQHIWQATWANLKNGHWCPYCNKHSVDEKFIKNFIKEKGAKFLNNWSFISSKTKFELICKNGHNFKSCWDKIRANHWCPACYGNDKPSESDIKNIIKRKNGHISFDWTYKSAFDKFFITCSKGHIWQSNWVNLRKGHWCPHCINTKSENEFRECVEKFFISEFPKIKPIWLKNPETGRLLELDGFNKEKKVAFEYQGPFHYKNNWLKKEKVTDDQIKRDKIKVTECLKNGVALIVMPYWIPKENWEKEIRRQYDSLSGHICNNV